MAANATELYIEMFSSIRSEIHLRTCTDPESPQLAGTYEARPGRSYELRNPMHNVQVCVPIDARWATAMTLHFFARTEKALALTKYSKSAHKFLTPDGDWRGAYGVIAMPQVDMCIARFKEHPATRRAVVSMGGHEPQDLHRPACWSFIQFLSSRHGLSMIVYQRSLNLAKIMPVDLVVLSNLHQYVATSIGQELGSLFWTIGSLHIRVEDYIEPNYVGQRHQSLMLDYSVLSNANLCYTTLEKLI